jgi:hypothetical protein
MVEDDEEIRLSHAVQISQPGQKMRLVSCENHDRSPFLDRPRRQSESLRSGSLTAFLARSVSDTSDVILYCLSMSAHAALDRHSESGWFSGRWKKLATATRRRQACSRGGGVEGSPEPPAGSALEPP